jgi:hypothetical protein
MMVGASSGTIPWMRVRGGRSMSVQQYAVRETIAAARAVAGVRAQVRRGRVAQEFKHYLDQVYAAGRAGSLSLDGQNIFIYRALDGEHLTVDFCVGVKAPFTAAGAVLPLDTPGGPAAMTTHHGEYGRLGEANAAILEWVPRQRSEARRAVVGSVWALARRPRAVAHRRLLPAAAVT